MAQQIIDDGNDIREALPRTRTRGQHIARPAPRNANRLGLVPVQAQRASLLILRLVFAKNPRAFPVQRAPRHQLINGFTRRKQRVELNEGIRPEHTLLQLSFNKVVNVGIANLDKALDIRSIITNQPVAELKNIHTTTTLMQI